MALSALIITAPGDTPPPIETPDGAVRLPGQRSRYVAERNYVVPDREAGSWTARPDLEASGLTGPSTAELSVTGRTSRPAGAIRIVRPGASGR